LAAHPFHLRAEQLNNILGLKLSLCAKLGNDDLRFVSSCAAPMHCGRPFLDPALEPSDQLGGLVLVEHAADGRRWDQSRGLLVELVALGSVALWSTPSSARRMRAWMRLAESEMTTPCRRSAGSQ
jgi:hypothetical protein